MDTRVETHLVPPPHLGLALTEAHRALAEFSSLYLTRRFLDRMPKGDGHGVVLLPGFLGDDGYNAPLRRYLGRLGGALRVIELTRCYRFPAAHVLARDDFSAERNQRTYGKCANPGGHGHNYGVEVTVRGPVDETSGEVMSRRRLDRLVEEHVLARFAHRMLNDDPLFAERVPTAENIAAAIHEQLEDAVAAAGSAHLVRVRVHETRKNSFVHGEME